MSENSVAVSDKDTEVVAQGEEIQASQRRYLRPREIFAFCIAYFGNKNLEEFLNSNKQIFALDCLKLNPKVYANLIFATGIYDAVDDTISGLIIDRTRTRWGRVKPYLLLPLPILIISTLMMFTAPNFGTETGKGVWECIAMFLSGLGFSYFGAWYLVLYNNTPNVAERNSLITISETAKLFSTWIVSLIPLFLDIALKSGMRAERVYFFFAVLSLTIMVITCFYAFGRMRERIPLQSREEMNKVGIFESFKQLFKNRPMFIMVLANCFNSFKSVGSSNEKFFWFNCTGAYSYGTLAGLFTGMPNYIMTPLSGKWIKKYGARKTIIASGVFGFVAYLIMFLIGYAPFGGGDFENRKIMNLVYLIIALTVCGLPNSVIRVCLPSLMGDVYDYSEWKTGTRNEALVNTVSGYFQKLGYNISNWMSGMVLAWVHYSPIKDANDVLIPNTDPAIRKGLWAIFALAPAAARLLLGVACFFFNVHGKLKEDMLADLEEHRRLREQAMASEKELSNAESAE